MIITLVVISFDTDVVKLLTCIREITASNVVLVDYHF
jgi:hypothetical protein